MPQRVGNGVGAAGRADLGVQIHEMPFNRGHGDAQLGGDLLVHGSCRDVPQDLHPLGVRPSGAGGVVAPLADAPAAERVAVPARKKRSISPMVSSCIRPAIEFSATTMNSAPPMPAATSWHNSNDQNG